MKILLYLENEKQTRKSGVGRAHKHQIKALQSLNIEYTTDPNDSYDLAHINTIFYNSMKIFKHCKKNNIPVVMHAHSTVEDMQNSFVFSNIVAKLLKRRLIYLYSNADHVITPTPYSKKLIENYGVKNEITPLSNGIDLNAFANDDQDAFYNYFKLTQSDKVVLGVGLYFERKGIIDFVELATKFPQVTFIWFGHTPLYSIPRKIRQIIKNPPKNVIFPGYIDGEIIKGAYKAANLFFFPSYEETEGIVVLEALASKQIVLVRDIGVYDDWLQHNVNCLKAKDNIEFELYINEVVNENKHNNLRTDGYNVAKDREISKIGNQLVAIYKQLLTTK